ncbi:MAG: hypothetical protein OEV91_04000 [Desulfobulbaceae bacterium]|nr:hypothetical protein [Desulfobulbaceae bacterium]
MMSLLGRFALFCLLLCVAAPAWAGEQLVFALVHKGADFTAGRTELLAVDAASGKRHRLFDDQGLSLRLPQHLYVFHFPVAGGNRIFARGVERLRAAPGAIHELAVDGSNGFRKVCEAVGDEPPGEILVNGSGSRVGYLNRLGHRQLLFIHDVATGRLLSQVDLTHRFLDCYAASSGWLNDEAKLYFSLATGDEHVTSDESYQRAGSYLLEEEGGRWSRLAPVPASAGELPPERERLLGTLAGEMVYELMLPATGGKGGRFKVVRMRPDGGKVTAIGFSQGVDLYSGIEVCYKLSPSGRYLAAARLPISASARSWDIWLKDLKTGSERRLVTMPVQGLQGPFPGLVGWIDR